MIWDKTKSLDVASCRRTYIHSLTNCVYLDSNQEKGKAIKEERGDIQHKYLIRVNVNQLELLFRFLTNIALLRNFISSNRYFAS